MMTQTTKTHNYSDRNYREAMRQKGQTKARRIESEASQKAAFNPNAKRIEDCAYVKGRVWIAIG